MSNQRLQRPGRTTKPKLRISRVEVSTFSHLLFGGPNPEKQSRELLPQDVFVIIREYAPNVVETVASFALTMGGLHPTTSCELHHESSKHENSNCFKTSKGRVHIDWLEALNSYVMIPGQSCAAIDKLVHAIANGRYQFELVSADLDLLRNAPRILLIEETLKVHRMTEPNLYASIDIDTWLAKLVQFRLRTTNFLSTAINMGLSDARRLMQKTSNR